MRSKLINFSKKVETMSKIINCIKYSKHAEILPAVARGDVFEVLSYQIDIIVKEIDNYIKTTGGVNIKSQELYADAVLLKDSIEKLKKLKNAEYTSETETNDIVVEAVTDLFHFMKHFAEGKGVLDGNPADGE